MTSNKRYTNREYLDFFRSGLKDHAPETAHKYVAAISRLDLFLTGHRLDLADLSPVMTADLTAALLLQGLSRTTVVRDLNILSSLVKKAVKTGIMAPEDSPRSLARTLGSNSPQLPLLMDSRVYDACIASLQRAMIPGNNDVYIDMLMFSLLNGAMSLTDVAMLRRDGLDSFGEHSVRIAGRHTDHKRKYVFDLKQSYRTPRQLYSDITAGLTQALIRLDAPVFGRLTSLSGFNPDTLSCSLWAACAVRSGATFSEATGCLDGPASYSVPSFCGVTLVGSDNRRLWAGMVSSVLTREMPRWYAMHLRRGVDFDELRKEITENVRPVPELFYPIETIRKRVGGKTVVNDRPFISGTAFFRSYPDRIPPMFNRIGDKAWCYRVTRSAGSPYAVIPASDMRRFQAMIGVFTPDMEVHPLGELTPKPGEPVIVVQAGYNNREGKVEEVIDTEGGTAIFRVRLSTDSGYEWRVDLGPHQLRRILN